MPQHFPIIGYMDSTPQNFAHIQQIYLASICCCLWRLDSTRNVVDVCPDKLQHKSPWSPDTGLMVLKADDPSCTDEGATEADDSEDKAQKKGRWRECTSAAWKNIRI